MRPYQERYIENCRAIQALTSSGYGGWEDFDRRFALVMDNRRRAWALAQENTRLLQEELLPLLDDLYLQGEDTLADLEEFADALNRPPKVIDVALACQLHEALLSCVRRKMQREPLIRELYKLGMARYGLWNMLSGLDIPEVLVFSSRMRYCFVEASSYLKYFDEFQDDETRGYILRSTGNIYMGSFKDWREKLDCVRNTMRVFTDSHYRETAPDLPWDSYLQAVHRQMAGVMPYNLTGGSLSPHDVADVMESAHLVYEEKFADSRHGGYSIDAHNLLPYYALEYSCGLVTKEQLLENMEALLDPVDPTRYDQETIFQIISLPPYYAQYLRLSPELIPPRRQYLAQLYDRMLGYVRAMPAEAVTDSVLLYVRQAISVFVEVEGGLTYRDLVLSLMARFAPELFAHSAVVAQLTQVICETILDGDPSFFDDLPEAAALSPADRRAAILTLADHAGLLHDIGRMNLTSLYDHMGRQMLRSEEEIVQTHTVIGWLHLQQYPSTRSCADAALGHHRWYDGSGGYPERFQRRESPYRALVDVLSIADYLEHETFERERSGAPISFEDRLNDIFEMEGRQFSPLATSWLRDAALQVRLREICTDGLREGLQRCLRCAAGQAPGPGITP